MLGPLIEGTNTLIDGKWRSGNGINIVLTYKIIKN